MPPRCLVILRVPRGSAAPDEARIARALRADRDALALPATAEVSFRVAGPYQIEAGGQAFDEYVAWEI